MTKLCLDSSVIVKRYIAEKGSESVARVYERSDSKEISICFSIWNIGEAIGAMDQYQRRGWITEDQFRRSLGSLAGETLRLMKIEALEVLPTSSTALAETWDLIRKHHIYQADALQIVSCARSKADMLLSADKVLLEVAEREGISADNIENARKIGEL
jgi:predicted nucleic acid-binding protein